MREMAFGNKASWLLAGAAPRFRNALGARRVRGGGAEMPRLSGLAAALALTLFLCVGLAPAARCIPVGSVGITGSYVGEDPFQSYDITLTAVDPYTGKTVSVHC